MPLLRFFCLCLLFYPFFALATNIAPTPKEDSQAYPETTDYFIYSLNPKGEKLLLKTSKSQILRATLQDKTGNHTCQTDSKKIKCLDLPEMVFNKEKVIYQTESLLEALQPTLTFSLRNQEVQYQYDPKKFKNTNSITINFICSNDSRLQMLLNLMYEQDFTCENGKATFMEVAKKSFDKYLEAYERGDKQESLESYLKHSPLEEITKDRVEYFDEEILSLRRFGYLYTGGAHGMPGEWGIIIAREGELVYLDKFLDLNNEELKKILWKTFQDYRLAHNIDIEDFTSYENFKPSDAMTLDNEGIIFLYQPYELLPYSYGIIELKLPFSMVKPFGDFARSPLKHLFGEQSE